MQIDDLKVWTDEKPMRTPLQEGMNGAAAPLYRHEANSIALNNHLTDQIDMNTPDLKALGEMKKIKRIRHIKMIKHWTKSVCTHRKSLLCNVFNVTSNNNN